MKNLKTIAFIAALTILLSCKKDKEDKPTAPSRTLRYEVSGNFTGTFIVSYTTASGGTANDQVTLPWTKEITYADNITAAIVLLTGNGGIGGQKVLLVTKRGGAQIATFEAVAEASGSFSKPAPVIVF
ncbi:hypothetical protein [Pedobacter frigiditerrae]|uniref:hypothetical protein n=1 Tax=Pedobacter frigiditerrae TaxID=2530452 RepID=UPI0029313D37|nr:hypothetical protein [Pedobacter frigiditerrae]